MRPVALNTAGPTSASPSPTKPKPTAPASGVGTQATSASPAAARAPPQRTMVAVPSRPTSQSPNSRPPAMAHENAPYPNVVDRMSAPPWASKVPLQSATAPSIINESIASRPSVNSARSGTASDLPVGATSPARITKAAASTTTAQSVAAAPSSAITPLGAKLPPRTAPAIPPTLNAAGKDDMIGARP